MVSGESRLRIFCYCALQYAVELLKLLPEGSKVGTIDKFQGQEAEVVIVSMTTSGPRNWKRRKFLV